MPKSQEYTDCLELIQELHSNDSRFESIAMRVFKYQYTHNPLLKQYAQLVSKTPEKISALEDIPFLPIEFFKGHRVQTGKWKEKLIFESSGTTGKHPSRHYVRSIDNYIETTTRHFEERFGNLEELVILALLPSYLERQNSSLIKMVEEFIIGSDDPLSGFYMYNFKTLSETLKTCMTANKEVVLIGVSFALVDFAEQYPMQLENIRIVETGGMKGRKKEMTREELHGFLKTQFKMLQIDSEYGMTELFSQAYMTNGTAFVSAPTMRVLATEVNDPLNIIYQKTGRLAIIDLANIDTCSFIQTNDLGVCYDNNTFQVLGRVDDSDTRGCNLLYVN